jgi:O-succinylbenzoate synthase
VTAASGRRQFVAQSPVPVLADETCGDVETAVGSVLGGLSTMLSVKPARTGVARSVQLTEFCRLTGTPVVIGSTGETALGVYGSAAVAAASAWTAETPAELLMHRDLAVDLAPRPQVVGGMLRLSDAPGLGADLDRAALDAVATGRPVVLRA